MAVGRVSSSGREAAVLSCGPPRRDTGQEGVDEESREPKAEVRSQRSDSLPSSSDTLHPGSSWWVLREGPQ